MEERPAVEYVENDGVNIAYSRWGHGPHVVVYTPPFVSNLELDWEIEEQARSLRHTAQHNEVVKLDKRGVGLSDRTNEAPTLEERVADTLAVLDAEYLDRVVLSGLSEGAAIAIAIAARHPERVEKLVVIGAALPGVPTAEVLRHVEPGDPEPAGLAHLAEVVAKWGTEDSVAIRYFSPDADGDPRVAAWAHRMERQSASPGSLRAHLTSALRGDIRDDIGRVACPTLIGHCIGDLVVPVACSRYLAEQWPHAVLRLWDDPNHAFAFSPRWREIHDDCIEFVNGTRPIAETTATFAAVLFTDIVDSTVRAGQAGDDAWARLIRPTTPPPTV